MDGFPVRNPKFSVFELKIKSTLAFTIFWGGSRLYLKPLRVNATTDCRQVVELYPRYSFIKKKHRGTWLLITNCNIREQCHHHRRCATPSFRAGALSFSALWVSRQFDNLACFSKHTSGCGMPPDNVRQRPLFYPTEEGKYPVRHLFYQLSRIGIDSSLRGTFFKNATDQHGAVEVNSCFCVFLATSFPC